MRVVELFAGIGAQHAALTRLGIEAEYTVCEIDRRAYEAYCAVHGPTPNLGDIRAVERLPPSDLVTWSFPCTTLSIAGTRTGMEEGSGTASSLGWEVLRILRATPERERPRHLLMENVPMLLSRKYRAAFEAMCRALRALGYSNSHAILNATDYGVPQSRRRVFMVSSRDGVMTFPAPRPLTRSLRDVMENDVPASYFLNEKAIMGYQRHKERNDAAGHGFGWRPQDPVAGGVAKCVTATHDGANATYLKLKGHRPVSFEADARTYDPAGIAYTVRCELNHNGGGWEVEARDDVARVEVDGETVSIRRLTERECWRLMGFTDAEFDRARDAGIPRTHLYRQAGNSIVVDVLVAIFDAMLVRHDFRRPGAEQTTLDAWGCAS